MSEIPKTKEKKPLDFSLEAMASGLPVIASKIDGITDWVINDGENGLLFEMGNNDELGNSLLRLLQNKDFSLKLGLRARETVSRSFSIEKVATGIFHFIKISYISFSLNCCTIK